MAAAARIRALADRLCARCGHAAAEHTPACQHVTDLRPSHFEVCRCLEWVAPGPDPDAA